MSHVPTRRFRLASSGFGVGVVLSCPVSEFIRGLLRVGELPAWNVRRPESSSVPAGGASTVPSGCGIQTRRPEQRRPDRGFGPVGGGWPAGGDGKRSGRARGEEGCGYEQRPSSGARVPERPEAQDGAEGG